MNDNWLEDIMRGNETTSEVVSGAEKKATATVPRPRPSGMPTHPSEWGSGGKVNPLPGEEEVPASTASESASSVSVNTPEEDGELRKRKEANRKQSLPPMPKQPPTVHENGAAEKVSEEAPKEAVEGKEAVGEEAQEAEETRGRIRAALHRARTVTGSTKEKISEKTKPVREKVANEIDPRRAQKWSLLWAGGASWLISPGTLGALYDRTVLLFDSWTENFPRAEYLNSGGLPHEWDLLQGPAWWVRETVGAAFESGATSELLVSALVGLIPTVTLIHLNHRIVRFFLVIGVAYFVGFEWFPQWWEVYMATLVACAYYGWTMANRIRSAFLACMLRVPVAAIVSGTILYSPGAIF